jgi:hypothetical protein
MSYLGLGGYQAVAEEVTEWQVDFRADMARFVAGPLPRVGDFDLGLHCVDPGVAQVHRCRPRAPLRRRRVVAVGAGSAAARAISRQRSVGRPR